MKPPSPAMNLPQMSMENWDIQKLETFAMIMTSPLKKKAMKFHFLVKKKQKTSQIFENLKQIWAVKKKDWFKGLTPRIDSHPELLILSLAKKTQQFVTKGFVKLDLQKV